MDKNEYNIKLQTIKKLASKGEYKTAADLADEIDWRKHKGNSMLMIVAQVYESAKEYDRAKEVLLIAYERTPKGRQIAYRLCNICLKNQELEEAKEFYLDFVDMAPRDSAKYILQYQIAKASGADLETLIQALESYMDDDMDERWSYELARLYAQVGRSEDCIQLCDQLSLWFTDGKYVVRALRLKSQFTPLTKSQQDLVNRALARELTVADERAANSVRNSAIRATLPNPSLQKALPGQTSQGAPEGSSALEDLSLQKGAGVQEQESVREEASRSFDEDEIDVDELGRKTINVIRNDAMDMSNEIAKSMKKIMEEEQSQKHLAPSLEFNREELEKAPDFTQVVSIARKMPDPEEIEKAALQVAKDSEYEKQKESEEILEDTGFEAGDIKERAPHRENSEEEGEVFETTYQMPAPKVTQVKENDLDPLFTMDEDGQISMDMGQKEEDLEDDNPLTVNEALKDLALRGILHSSTVTKAIDVVSDGEEAEEGTILQKEEERQEEVQEEEKKPDELDKVQVSLSFDAMGNVSLKQPGEIVQLNSQLEEIGFKPNESIMARQGDVVELGVEDLLTDGEIAAKKIRAEEEAKKEKETTEKEESQEPQELDEVDQVLALVKDLQAKKDEKPEEQKTTEDFDIPDSPDDGKYVLADEYRKKFSRFLSVTGLENSLARTISHLKENYDSDGTSRTNNVIIIGETKSGKSTLAADLIKAANKERGRKGRKIAKINGNNINKKGIVAAMPRLLGSDLIIENAGIINATMAHQMMSAFEGYTDEMIVILEGDRSTMDRLLETHPALKDMFNNEIVIKEYDINEWVGYAKAYAREQGYQVDDIGTLALYAKIDSEYGRNRGLEKEDVDQIIDRAIDKVNGKGIGKLFGKVFGREKSSDLKVIKESDFD